jgi:hypothetical protein
VVAVAHHQPVTVLVHLAAMRIDIAGNLGLQRRSQHLTGRVTDNLIQQRRTRRSAGRVGPNPFVHYLEHGRTFPNQRSNAGPDQSKRTSDHPREGALPHVTPPKAIHRF